MEINEVIRDLISKGMSKEDIVNTLKQMGLDDAENLVSKATEFQVEAKAEDSKGEVQKQSVSVVSPDFSELKAKLEILIDLNKQILESQRQLLLKLK